MGSSKKKKRGQQRKAAKKEGIPPSISFESNADGSGAKVQENKEYIIKHIQDGSHSIANTLANHHITNFSLVDSGVVSAVLGFLRRCEEEFFIRVVRTNGKNANLQSPSLWIRILDKAVEFEPGSRLQVAQRIGPLISCFCNDTGRLFFKGNEHWKEGILPFVKLIEVFVCTLTSSSSIGNTNMTVLNTLLNHEGLLSSIVQWAFWDVEHRPDLVKELGAKDCELIASLGWQVSRWIIPLLLHSRGWLEAMGSIPIVNKQYDPSCKISFAEGLLRVVARVGISAIRPFIDRVIVDADCIDKGVITEAIGLGTNSTTDISSAEIVTKLASRTICIEISEDMVKPNDARTAFAIRSGLLEMCFGFMERFYSHSSTTNDDRLFYFIEHIFRDIYDLSLHQKTARAIRSKKIIIEEKLLCLEQNTNITNYTECKDLLGIAKSILSLSGCSYCCRCNKSLSKTEVMECNGCRRMVYCSRSCQKEDWVDGHLMLLAARHTMMFQQVIFRVGF